MIGRLTISALLLASAACATYPDAPMPAPPAGHGMCDADEARHLVGQVASSALGGEALKRTGASTLRWIQPDTIVTMDYRPDRLNIKLSAANRVETFTCG